MKFVAGELSFNASVAEVSRSVSAQTGAELVTMTIQFRLPKPELHEQALAVAEGGRQGGLFSTDEDNQAEWRVLDSGFSYIGTEPWGMHHHTWRIEQVERVACTALVLDELRLEVYDYREVVADQGGLRLAARAVASEADLLVVAELSLFGRVVQVVREGVSAEPRRMRVDGYVWGGGQYGQAVALVCAEVGEPRVGLEVAPGAGEAAGRMLVQALLEGLEQAGVLAAEAVQGLRRRVRDAYHATRRVQDVDSWPL